MTISGQCQTCKRGVYIERWCSFCGAKPMYGDIARASVPSRRLTTALLAKALAGEIEVSTSHMGVSGTYSLAGGWKSSRPATSLTRKANKTSRGRPKKTAAEKRATHAAYMRKHRRSNGT